MSNSSSWPIDSVPRSNGNEEVLCIPPRFQHYWNLTIRLFNVISRTLTERILLLCRDAVCVFYLMDVFYLLISPLKVLHCLHRVLNSHSLGMSLALTNDLITDIHKTWLVELEQSTLVSEIKGWVWHSNHLKKAWNVQWLKRCDKHCDKEEDDSLKNVNNIRNTSS